MLNREETLESLKNIGIVQGSMPSEKWNLGGADLSFSDLNGADLIGADLGRANLDAANLSVANLEGSIFNISNNTFKKNYG